MINGDNKIQIENPESRRREVWADYVKAFAIFLMVLCHFNLSNETARQFIYMFHMPVFFLISGYFDKGAPTGMGGANKFFRTLFIPYLFFSVFALLYCWISPYLHPEMYHINKIWRVFVNAIMGMLLMEDAVLPYSFMPCGPLWFLVAIFEIKLFFSLLCYCWQQYKAVIPALLIIPITIVYMRVPFFSLDSASLGLIFYILGYILKKSALLKYLGNIWVAIAIAIIMLVYLWFVGMLNGGVDIDGCTWGHNFWMFCINGLLGSVFCIAVAKSIRINIPFISEIGQSTLTILGIHGFIGILGKTFCVIVMHYDVASFPILASVIMSVIAVVLGVFVQRFLVKYIPWAVGK